MRRASRMGRSDSVKLAEESSDSSESGGRPCLSDNEAVSHSSGRPVTMTDQTGIFSSLY